MVTIVFQESSAKYWENNNTHKMNHAWIDNREWGLPSVQRWTAKHTLTPEIYDRLPTAQRWAIGVRGGLLDKWYIQQNLI